MRVWPLLDPTQLKEELDAITTKLIGAFPPGSRGLAIDLLINPARNTVGASPWLGGAWSYQKEDR